MLLKVKLGDVQKFVRITEPNLTEFLSAGKKLGYNVILRLSTGWSCGFIYCIADSNYSRLSEYLVSSRFRNH